MPDAVSQLIRHSCVDCHSNGNGEGGFEIDEFAFELDDEVNRRQWTSVLRRVQAGEMPPADHEQPDARRRDHFIEALTQSLVVAQLAQNRRQGRSRIRRLNRSEYESTLSDILQTPLRIADLLPEDGRRDGFDTVGEALHLSSVQMEAYLDAIDVALDTATKLHEKPKRQKFRLTYKESVTLMQTYRRGQSQRIEPDGVLLFADELFSHGNYGLPQWCASYDGHYRISLSAYAMHSEQPIVLTLRAGGIGHSESRHVPSQILKHFVVPPGDPQNPVTLSWEGHLQRGHYLHVTPSSLRPFRFANNLDGLKQKLHWDGPGVLVQHIDVDGPIISHWPPRSHEVLWAGVETRSISDVPPNPEVNAHLFDPPSKSAQPKNSVRRPGDKKKLRNNQDRFVYSGPTEIEGRIIGGEPIHKNQPIPPPVHPTRRLTSVYPDTEVRRLLGNFIPKAFRCLPNQIRDEDVAPYVEIALQWIQEGSSFEAAMRTAYKAVLCSPRFLFRQDSLPQRDGSPNLLAHNAIAERLAFLLCHGPADSTLLSSDLGDPITRREQAMRLLNDPRTHRFRKHFVDQWLDLRLLDFTTPDSLLYPEHNMLLQWSIEQETRSYFDRIIDENRPVSELIDSDWLMLNRRLARHYGLLDAARACGVDDIDGMNLRPVSLPDDSVRGGFLTQASILKVTANGTSTSPVVRGVWVLDRLLGDPPPPPPPGIPAIEPDIRGAITVVQQLEKHRRTQSCAVCHNDIDPPGLALEAFDVIGGFREHYRTLDPDEADRRLTHKPKPDPVAYQPGPPVQCSATYRGSSFEDIQQLKRILLSDQRQLARNLVSKWITYATGSEITIADQDTVESILDETATDEFRMKDLLLAVIASDLFTQK